MVSDRRMMNDTSPPDGYRRFDERGAIIVARRDVADAIIAAYRNAPADRPTIHGYASRSPDARSYEGRELAYGLTFPGTPVRAVVRHNRHGGTLRGLTGDLFRRPTRAPRELAISIELAKVGILTPPVLAYALYPSVPGFARSDVVTEEIPDSTDLGSSLLDLKLGSSGRPRIWAATGALVKQLSAAGARHHDLNVKNILLQPMRDGSYAAYTLDVDRVELGLAPAEALAGNSDRLLRSIAKWRRRRNASITDGDLAAFSTYLRADSATTSS